MLQEETRIGITRVVSYLYIQTSKTIYQLKTDAYKATSDEKYAYLAPDGKTFRNKRPDQQLMNAGWAFARVKFHRIKTYMSPRHERWRDYLNMKRRATLLLAVRLILKANNGTVPAKEEISPLVSTGIFRSHARTASRQKALAHSAYRYLHKLNNRLHKQPHRFTEIEAWFREREQRRRLDE